MTEFVLGVFMLGSALDSEDAWREMFLRPAVRTARERTEHASEEELRMIVASNNDRPWYSRLLRRVFFESPLWFRDNLEYLAARDMLLGTFSWEDIDKLNEKHRRDAETRREEWLKQEEVLRAGRGIELFPGSLEEYCQLKGMNFEFVDVPGREKHISPPRSYEESEVVVSLGITSLVRYDSRLNIGLPVRCHQSLTDDSP